MTLRSSQAVCLDQQWRALRNDSRRLRSHLKRCNASSRNAPALLLFPVALNLRRLSSQLSQHQQLLSPDLVKLGRAKGIGQRGGVSIQSPPVWAVTRCMDVALAPLRQMGIHILNYLDDWLILAQSEADLTSHKTLLLSHLCCLGLRVNFAKSILSPSQRVSFLGTVIHSAQMTADDSNCLGGASHHNSAPSGFLQGRYRPSAQSFPENAGLMAAASPVVRLVYFACAPSSSS